MNMPAPKFGRIHHLPAEQISAVIEGMRDRGLIGDDGWLTEQGRAVKQRVESLTDDLAGEALRKPRSSRDRRADQRPRAAAIARWSKRMTKRPYRRQYVDGSEERRVQERWAPLDAPVVHGRIVISGERSTPVCCRTISSFSA